MNNKDSDISRIKERYNLLIIFTTIVWFLILLLHIYRVVDKIFFRNGSVIAILIISALISMAVMEMHRKRRSKIGNP